MDALRAGLADGTIDAVASGHTPRSVDEKTTEFQEAVPGATGLETMLAVVFTELVRPGLLTLGDAVKTLSASPAGILGVEGGSLVSGGPADLLLFDPDGTWTVGSRVLQVKILKLAIHRPRAGRVRNHDHRRRPGQLPARRA